MSKRGNQAGSAVAGRGLGPDPPVSTGVFKVAVRSGRHNVMTVLVIGRRAGYRSADHRCPGFGQNWCTGSGQNRWKGVPKATSLTEDLDETIPFLVRLQMHRNPFEQDRDGVLAIARKATLTTRGEFVYSGFR